MVERLTPERRRELTRSALIEAAVDVFARKGFHAASLDEIAEAAGFTRGAIYSNFDGKEDLFLAVLDRVSEQNLSEFTQGLEGAPGGTAPAMAVDIWARTPHYDLLNLLILEMRLYALRNPDFRQRLADTERKQTERIATFIAQEAARLGRSVTIPVSELAGMLRAAADGLAQAAAIDSEQREFHDRVARAFFQLIDQKVVVEAPRGD